MTINRAFSIGVAAIVTAIALGCAGSALARACTHDGPIVMCNDGRRGLLSGDAIVWPEPDAASERHHRQQGFGDRRTGRVRRSGQRRGAAG